MDELTAIFAYQQMQFTQLQTGKFTTDLLGIVCKDFAIMRVHVGLSLQACGAKPEDAILFLIMLEMPASAIYSCNSAISPENSLFGFDSQNNDFICQGACVFAQVAIKTETFWRYTHQLQRDDLDERYLSSNHVLLAPDRSEEIREYLQGLFWILETMPARLQKPRITALIAEDLIPLLICALPRHSKTGLSVKPFRRHLLVAKAKRVILEHLEKPLTLKQLAQGLESSSSALSYGFQDAFGISPMRYLKVQRLHALRRCLKTSDPTIHNIQALSNQFGFWSAGHFARDYKAMFGELPSETLRESA
ncbi:MAG: helix-turn-helix domain-containing protein [Cyanobacteria bacterium P01_B01_bin.77]